MWWRDRWRLALILCCIIGTSSSCSCFKPKKIGCAADLGGFDDDTALTTSGSGGSGGGLPCELMCGVACCDEGEICYAGGCALASDGCISPSDCSADFICDFSLDGPGGDVLDGVESEQCAAPFEGQCVERAILPVPCGLEPAETVGIDPGATFGATLDVASTPAALQLEDTNCDGIVDRFDAPRMFFLSSDGVLHAVQMRGGDIKWLWSSPPATPSNDPASTIAVATTYDGGTIIAVCTDDERVRAYDETGYERWLGQASARCDSLQIADMDKDNQLEVISESQVLRSHNGTERISYGPAFSRGFAVRDHEIFTSSKVYKLNGQILTPVTAPDGYVALAGGDVVSVDPAGSTITVWNLHTTEVVQIKVDYDALFGDSCPVSTPSGGPPAIGDIDGDGKADVAISTALGVVAFDRHLATPLWIAPRLDCEHGQRAAMIFDLDGDYFGDVLLYERASIEVLSGENGALLASTCNSNEGGLAAPLAIDTDGDGFGEIVACEAPARPR